MDCLGGGHAGERGICVRGEGDGGQEGAEHFDPGDPEVGDLQAVEARHPELLGQAPGTVRDPAGPQVHHLISSYKHHNSRH